MEELWNAILDFTAQFVIPDWGALVGLIPVGLLLLVLAFVARTAWRFAHAGPTRRAPLRREPLPPPGTHMPGPSFAPVLAAFGAFMLLLGLVAGGPWLGVGVVILVLTLLYWGREALADYDHLARIERLPAVQRVPPPGVHMPGPSFRPVLASLAMAVLFFGLVFGGWLLLVGVLFLVATLIGWLGDARKEYVKTTEADATGHLENIPAPTYPARLLAVFAALIVVAVAVDAGVLLRTPGGAAGNDGEPGASPGGSAGPSSPAGGEADATLVAVDIAFDTHELSVPADTPFTIAIDNQDPAGVEHDVDIRDAAGTTLQDQETLDGGTSIVYEYEPLAAGSYTFICSIHPIPAMTGTLTVQ